MGIQKVGAQAAAPQMQDMKATAMKSALHKAKANYTARPMPAATQKPEVTQMAAPTATKAAAPTQKAAAPAAAKVEAPRLRTHNQ